MTRAWSQFNDNACSALSPSQKSEDATPLSPGSAGITLNTAPKIDCIPTDNLSQAVIKTAEPAHIPCRNLSEAFEELYVAAPVSSSTTPGIKKLSQASEKPSNLISPTGVIDLDSAMEEIAVEKSDSNVLTPLAESSVESDEFSFVVPQFNLHTDLKLDLSQGVINRVSMYAVIHDINKEATSMAANDDSSFSRPADENSEEFSPLIVAVNGLPSKSSASGENPTVDMALIDDERWLLSAIGSRGCDESRQNQACPPTFLQAMGEREYENPLASLSNGSRTQLWKPSRSWWEAKSGKNPWIEPKSHNKRWRYLWPLIHYHKFLAKCIKKLKRNGVDVKMSVSPVAAFLREEVCAVSDHLAAVSLFDSEKWMNCLEYFSGWADAGEESEGRLRTLVSKLKLRPLAEPGDVDSPLLRSQIDDQFLRAMVAARTQMEMSGEPSERRKATKVVNRSQNHQQSREGCVQHASSEPMPAQPQQHSSPYQRIPSHVGGQYHTAGGVRRPRMGYPYQWWGQGYGGPAPYALGDDTGSVHSSLSGDAYSDFAMYPATTPHAGYYPPVFHQPAFCDQPQPNGGYVPGVAEHPVYSVPDVYNNPEQAAQAGLGWVGHAPYDPSVAYTLQQNTDAQGYYVTPAAPAAPPSPHEVQSPYHAPTSEGVMGCNPSIHMESFSADHTPYKYDASQMPLSPFWAHLDRATLTMGLATPQTNPPKTPIRECEEEKEVRSCVEGPSDVSRGSDAGFAGNAQPLLLRQSQYYNYAPYGPPSPATQFMMSPQANFAYNYGYGFSPGRPNSHAKGQAKSRVPSQPDANNSCRNNDETVPGNGSDSGLSPPDPISKVLPYDDRESPSTVETIAESESIQDTA